MSLLHWAAATGNIPLIERLVKVGAPLEARNTWGGTVLDSTTYFVCNAPIPGADYAATIQALLDAGADVRACEFPTGNKQVDEVLTRWKPDKL